MPVTCQQKLIVCINIGLLNEADSRIASLVDTDDLLSRSFFLGKIERATFCSWKFDVLTVRNWYIIGYYLFFNSTRQRVLQSTPQEFLPLAWCLTVLRNFIHAIPRSRHLREPLWALICQKEKTKNRTFGYCYVLSSVTKLFFYTFFRRSAQGLPKIFCVCFKQNNPHSSVAQHLLYLLSLR